MCPDGIGRHVLERLVAFLSVQEQANVRRASKKLWEAVSAVSLENLLRATVIEYHDALAVDAQLVVVVMSRAVLPFPSDDAAVALWSGGLPKLYEELRLRFPCAAAFGISFRLMDLCPFPFANRTYFPAMCLVTTLEPTPPAHAIESIALGVCSSKGVSPSPRILVPVLERDGAPSALLCLEGAPEHAHTVRHDAFALQQLSKIELPGLAHCGSLTSLTLTQIDNLESIGEYAFSGCHQLARVCISQIDSLKEIGFYAFSNCRSLQSVTLRFLVSLKRIGVGAFRMCPNLAIVDVYYAPISGIDYLAFAECESLQHVSFENLETLKFFGDDVFSHSLIGDVDSRTRADVVQLCGRVVFLLSHVDSMSYRR